MRHTFLLVLALACTSTTIFSQGVLQHPGLICCNQVICEGEPIATITEELATTPPDNQLNIEYAWHELVADTSTPTGTRWKKIANTNSRTFQPTEITLAYGGFYMRAARQVGTTAYMFSNVVNVKQLPASSAECTSSSPEAPVAQRAKLTPNPASDILRLNTPNWAISAYQVMAADGSVEANWKGEATNEVVISVADFAAGFYFLQVRFEDGKSATHKWVKL